MIASHYAAPSERKVALATTLRETAAADGPAIRQMKKDEPFQLLDDSLGWAWGYAGAERRVGYVRSETLA